MRQKKSNIQDFKLFTALFIALNLVFCFYQTTFFWGNHDWDWIKGTDQLLALNTGMFEARYAKFILNVFLFGGHILPILNNVVAFALLALGAILTTHYWQLKNFGDKLLVGLFITLSPYILGWLYFPINILGNFAAVALVAGGLLLFETKKSVLSYVLSLICFLLALGVYPSVMEMMIILILFKHILCQPLQFKEFIKPFVLPFLALVIFKLMLLFLSAQHLIAGDYYNLQTVSAAELVKRVPDIVKLAFEQLILPLPFMNVSFKILSLLIVLTAFFSLRHIYSGLLFVAAFIITALSSWLTATPVDTAFMPRVNFYGVNFFIAGAMAVLLIQKGFRRNLGLLFAGLLILQSITADFYAEKVWAMGKTAEENMVLRIAGRVENEENFKPRVPVVAGELSLRPRYYHDFYLIKSPYLLDHSFMVRHIPSGMFNFYTAENLFDKTSVISSMSDELYHFLNTADKPYPHYSSLFIDDDYVIMLLTKDGIKAIKAQLPK